MLHTGLTRIGRSLFAISFSVAFLYCSHALAQSTGKQILHGHVPSIVRHLTPTGRLPSTQQLNLSIGLPLRNQAELEKILAEVSDPASPNYRHYLTPEQFAAQFGPTEAEYRKAENFFRANGLDVTEESANRVLLNVKGSVGDIERVFQVTLRTYRHPSENRIFFAPDTDPSIDSSVDVLDVSGLTDLPRPHSKLVIQPAESADTLGAPNAAAPRAIGSGPNNNYIGGDFRRAYAPGVTLTGAGQTVALLQFDGYYPNDITNYEGYIGMAVTNFVPLTNVYIDGYNGAPGSGNTEVSLDLEMVISMAPGVSRIIVYEGNPTNGFFFPNDTLNRIATDNAASQISSSWGWNGGPSATTENIFKQMIAQGQTYFNASGDSDAFTNNQVDLSSQITQPSSSTNIVQVGATTLLATNPVSETVWNWGNSIGPAYDGAGSSGGISSFYAIPYWQTNISMTANHGSTSFRNIPDVAMVGDNIFVKYGNGLNATNVGGTSCAAPLWAGFTALINQRAAQGGRPVVGFINPAIYAIGKSANYTSDFNDVTTGNNFWSQSPTNFPAVAGYDLCTGWGSPKGANLINALAVPDTLLVTPGAGFSAFGVNGGPFSASSQTFVLSNSSLASLNWTLLNPSGLFNASASSGTLSASASTTVTVQLNSTGLNLLPGIYNPVVTFSNRTTGIGQDRQFSLQVGQSPVQNGGFETGDFSLWNFIGTGISGGVLYNGVVWAGFWSSPVNYGTNFVHSGTYGAALGQAGGLAYLYQAIPTIPGQTYLISFWLDAVPDDSLSQFIVNWNTNWPATNTVYNIANVGPFGWTNVLLLVTATGTNTVLQFDNENDNGYYGLDDIAVYPIPSPSLRSITTTNKAAIFTWNAFTNFSYRVQYSTNLVTTNWITFLTNVAPGSVASVTNAYGSDPRRFYRIQRLP